MNRANAELLTVAEPSLDALKALVCTDMEVVTTVMFEALGSWVPLIPQLGAHLLKAGGKRIRPMLTLATSYLCGAPRQAAINLAACVEFIHGATLLHDDVVDESVLRRGEPTANAVWGNQASVLVGDFLFARAFQLMVKEGSLSVLALLSDTAAKLSEGEILQLSLMGDVGVTQDLCLEVMTAKTAPLFEAATGVGALLVDSSTEVSRALKTYGRALGICFQVVDDVLDYVGKTSAFGKKIGGDFLEGKVTLPVVLAYQSGSQKEQAFWTRIFIPNAARTQAEWRQALVYLEKHKAFERAMDVAKTYALEAKNALSLFSPTHITQALQQTVDFTIQRKA
ncbi:MAG: polyprenyl synthetase family protein [Alphaproteobacteria bacterium]|nr:polyprenyl synthetase family protein [Alphaproteobacteria bacterium]